jgi:hypothetical protein
MVHLALGKHCWLGLWLITLIVLSSGFLVQSWFRNTLGKALEWLENFSSWPGLFCSPFVHPTLRSAQSVGMLILPLDFKILLLFN